MTNASTRRATLFFCTVLTVNLVGQGAENLPLTPKYTDQRPIARVERMALLPQPLAVRDWPAIARAYYQRVLDPKATGEGLPAVELPSPKPGARPGFRMKSYLGQGTDQEAFTCLGAVAGAHLVGLDPRQFLGQDYLRSAKAWYDPAHGLYRHRPGERSSQIHADIYGYWAAILGTILAAEFPQDAELQSQALTAVRTFQTIAHGLGCPTDPNYDLLGWDLAKNAPGGRKEPANRLGHAPSVAWMLLIGETLTHDPDMLSCARATLRWYIEHPGRYEISHMMGPLAAARLNAMGTDRLDMDKLFAAWFGDGDPARHVWGITAGTSLDGLTCDGIDGANWKSNGFYGFAMGTLQGPAWLVPVVRYDPRYARAIGRYALHAANSARLFQGEGLDANHQDHAAWKAANDEGNLYFYEGLASWEPSIERSLHPYATGDVVKNAWHTGHAKVAPKEYLQQRSDWFGKTPLNISLYMGNHVGFLGGIMQLTNVPGILSWDCLASDWFHPPAYPTRLVFNPYPQVQNVTLEVGVQRVDLWDLVSQQFVARGIQGRCQVSLPPDSAQVLVAIPAGVALERQDGQLKAGEIVVDFGVH